MSQPSLITELQSSVSTRHHGVHQIIQRSTSLLHHAFDYSIKHMHEGPSRLVWPTQLTLRVVPSQLQLPASQLPLFGHQHSSQLLHDSRSQTTSLPNENVPIDITSLAVKLACINSTNHQRALLMKTRDLTSHNCLKQLYLLTTTSTSDPSPNGHKFQLHGSSAPACAARIKPS